MSLLVVRACQGCILTVSQDYPTEISPYTNGGSLPHLAVCLHPCHNHYNDVGDDCAELNGKADCEERNIR